MASRRWSHSRLHHDHEQKIRKMCWRCSALYHGAVASSSPWTENQIGFYYWMDRLIKLKLSCINSQKSRLSLWPCLLWHKWLRYCRKKSELSECSPLCVRVGSDWAWSSDCIPYWVFPGKRKCYLHHNYLITLQMT